MLNKKEFEKIRREIAAFDMKREQVIQLSREIINLSKRIIYALHRNDAKTASLLVKDIENKKKYLQKIHLNADTNIDRIAMQEYAEAICYYEFVKNNKIPTKASLKLDNESYLLGLCDLSGELVRKAVNEAINGNFKQTIKIKDLVAEIYDEFLKFNLRNSELRKKSDQIKWSLMKLEDLAYDLTIKGKLK